MKALLWMVPGLVLAGYFVTRESYELAALAAYLAVGFYVVLKYLDYVRASVRVADVVSAIKIAAMVDTLNVPREAVVRYARILEASPQYGSLLKDSEMIDAPLLTSGELADLPNDLSWGNKPKPGGKGSPA